MAAVIGYTNGEQCDARQPAGVSLVTSKVCPTMTLLPAVTSSRLLARSGRPIRDMLDSKAVEDLDRLEQGQLQDGRWTVDFTSYSDAASLEWRGCARAGAVAVLRVNGR